MLSKQADKEPVMEVQIEGETVKLMVDTGATFTCICTADAQHLPLSSTGKVAKTVGFSGQIQIIPFSDPVLIQMDGREIRMPVLISDHTPINLLGRDALCRMGVQIECTPAGLSLFNQSSHSIMAPQTLITSQFRQIYWLGLFGLEWEDKIWGEWGPLINRWHAGLRKPRCPTHCTIMVEDVTGIEGNGVSDKMWREALNGRTQVELQARGIIVGPEGVAVPIRMDSPLHIVARDLGGIIPHITLKVGLGFRTRDVGRMMERASVSKWLPAKELGKGDVELSQDGTLMRIKHSSRLTGEPQVVTVSDGECQEEEYTADCPYGNPYCLYGRYEGIGYKCWNVDLHRPLNDTERLMYKEGEKTSEGVRKWKMMILQEGTEVHKNGVLKAVPDQVWATGDFDIGLVKSVSPLEFRIKPGAKLPFQKQYPISPEAAAGVQGTIEGLLQAGVLEKVPFARCNTPIYPVLKADRVRWRMVQDLRCVNAVVEDWPADVPNPHTLLTNIPSDATVFSVIDATQAFFSIPLAEKSRELFAFQYMGQTYRYTRMPQGFKHSPHVFNQAIRNDLKHLVCRSTILQYVDDLLICGPDVHTCEQDTIAVLQALAEGGHKVSRKKLQFAESQVTYLGRLISQGEKGIAPDHIQALIAAPKPQTVRHMMSFIGLIGFSSEWIECHEQKIAPLRALIAKAGSEKLTNRLAWTIDGEEAFNLIKCELQRAPALVLPDYTKPFALYVSVKKETGRDAYMTGILMQAQCQGKTKQIIAYYCSKLDSVAQGYPPCYQGLEAVYMAYVKASGITMGWPVNIYTSHAISQLMDKGRFCLTAQRQLKYYDLTFCPDVTVKSCDSVNNPADRVPLEYDGSPHDCVADSVAFSKLRPDLESEPLKNGEVVYFVDGSSHNYDNKTHAGFSVVQMAESGEFNTVMCIPCEQPCSAQLAELKALTEACSLAEGMEATIHTDSAYSHNVCHVYGAQWKQRGFKRSDGSPIQHQEQIQLLLAAMMRPKRLAICKCRAHKKGTDYVTLGNAKADEVAKTAALQSRVVDCPQRNGAPHSILLAKGKSHGKSVQCPSACPYSDSSTVGCKWCSLFYTPGHLHHREPLCCAMCQRGECALCFDKPCEQWQPITQGPVINIQPHLGLADIINMQEEATPWEKDKWVARGAHRGRDKVWRSHCGRMIAPHVLLALLITDAHDLDHCARGEVRRKILDEGFWSPYMQEIIDNKLAQCYVCNTYNVRQGIATKPLGHFPMPEGPFKHLVIDYIDMGKTIRKHRYVLVVVDRFSRWVEACPSPGPDSETVIKFFTREILPRFGIPEVVSSDNGKAFVEKTWAKIMQALGIKRRLGCIYHPQSQGMVERANGVLKGKIAKICASSNLNWLDALPIALMHMRSQKNRTTHLTPHEMLTERVMPTPRIRGDDKGPPLEHLQREIRCYVQQLSLIHETIYAQAKEREPVNNPQVVTAGLVQPGDWVYVKVFRRKSLHPRREGPYRVTHVTPTAVRVQGSSVWYHLNFCCRALKPGDDKEAQLSNERQDGGHALGAARPEQGTGGGPGTDRAGIGLTKEGEGPDCSGPGKPAGEMEERGRDNGGKYSGGGLSGVDLCFSTAEQGALEGGDVLQSGDRIHTSDVPSPRHPWQEGRLLDPSTLHNHPEQAREYQYDPLPLFHGPIHHPSE